MKLPYVILLGITKRFYIEKFHFIKPDRFIDLLEKVGLAVWPRFFLSAVEQLNKPSLPMPRKDKTLKLNHIVVNGSAW